MRATVMYSLSLVFVGAVAIALARVPSPTQIPDPDSQYRLGPDSLPQEGVP